MRDPLLSLWFTVIYHDCDWSCKILTDHRWSPMITSDTSWSIVIHSWSWFPLYLSMHASLSLSSKIDDKILQKCFVIMADLAVILLLSLMILLIMLCVLRLPDSEIHIFLLFHLHGTVTEHNELFTNKLQSMYIRHILERNWTWMIMQDHAGSSMHDCDSHWVVFPFIIEITCEPWSNLECLVFMSWSCMMGEKRNTMITHDHRLFMTDHLWSLPFTMNHNDPAWSFNLGWLIVDLVQLYTT